VLYKRSDCTNDIQTVIVFYIYQCVFLIVNRDEESAQDRPKPNQPSKQVIICLKS